MKPLPLLLKVGFLQQQFVLGSPVALLVDQLVEVGMGQTVELLLDGKQFVLQCLDLDFEGLAVLGSFLIDNRVNRGSLFGREGERAERFQALLSQLLFLQVGF